MALLLGSTRCKICELLIDEMSDVFATSGVFFEPEHPLWRFCDATMHWECYAAWPHRLEFARQYFRACLAGSEANPFWGIALRTEQVFVELNPRPGVKEVRVHLAETGSGPTLHLESWESWLWGDAPAAACHPVEEAALDEILPVLRSALPTRAALLTSVDWDARNGLLAEVRARAQQEERERLESAQARQAAFLQALQQHPVCPHCGERERLRVIDRGVESDSYLVCRACCRSFGHFVPAS